MDFEDILLEVGDYGRYQRNLIYYFLIPASSLLPWFTMNVLFMVSVPDHWCNVPEVISSGLSIADQRSLVSPPGEHCNMYNINFTEFFSNGSYAVPQNTTTRPCDQGWQYDQTYWDATAATKWDMVCDDAHYNSFVLTLFNVGSILGTPIYGALSDKIGRKITFFITIVVTVVTSVASVSMTNFIAFVVLKTLNGTLMPSVFQLPFIIVLEIVSPEMRTRMNMIINCAWTVGLCFLPLVAYLSRSWVILGVVTSTVTLILFLYWNFIPESPRWLVSQEKYEEATNIMLKIAKKNGKPEDRRDLKEKLEKLGEKLKKEKTVDGVQNSATDLLRYPQLRKKFIIITICWMADIMSYYGLQLNVGNLNGNEFINFFLLSLVEIPGYLTSWYVMEKFGRRWCSATGFLLIGVTCMFLNINIPYMDVICSMIGKFFSGVAFMATYQQSSELYPTVVRSLGMGMSSTISMIASLIVPYLIYLSVYGKAIPFLIIGLTCIVAGVLATFLPETLNENLPQSVFEAEDFGKKQKFFSFNRRKQSVSKERAASFGFKIKDFETICGMEEKDPKQQRSSEVLQNIEMVPGIENTLMVSESMKNVSGVFKKKSSNSGSASNVNGNNRNSISSERENQFSSVHFPVENTEMAEDNLSISEKKEATQNEENIENIPKNEEENFSYVNMVFEANDRVTKKEDSDLTGRKTHVEPNGVDSVSKSNDCVETPAHEVESS